MNNFIYSIEEIFSSCLDEHNVSGYYIGPYQRGYKWKSKTVHDQIPVLLTDLYEAYLKKKSSTSSSEYYLQYITVKRATVSNRFVFEVIDGQQRLTSITLLFNILEKYFSQDNIVKRDYKNLLEYSRYEDDNSNIFDTIHSLLESNTDIDKIQEQDKYYMYLASECFKKFFTILSNNSAEFNSFVAFIKENVKIILNKEDEFTAAEEVFSSLNANKVPLTNAYLIKGLLLTKASRQLSDAHSKKNFKEIMDERTIMARTWDDINNWFSRPDVSLYFFKKSDLGMERFLKLISMKTNLIKSDILSEFRKMLSEGDNKGYNNYELFNTYHENILSPDDALEYLNKIKHLFKRLKSWFEDSNLYNLVGYYLQTGGKIEELIGLDNENLNSTLKTHIYSKISKKGKDQQIVSLDKVGYKQDWDYVFKLLLALSIFPEGIDRTKPNNYKFDFYTYEQEGWSLEHIFPQNPDKDDFDYSEDIDWIVSQLEKKGLIDLVLKVTNGLPLSKEELNMVHSDFEYIDGLGNMALLSKKVNSALSNGFFNTKRKILLKKINSGSFVPKHTLDVFSKMLEAKKNEDNVIIPFDSNLMSWSNNDASAHANWIKSRISNLREEFNIIAS